MKIVAFCIAHKNEVCLIYTQLTSSSLIRCWGDCSCCGCHCNWQLWRAV